MDKEIIIENRAKGKFPVSIATSLALEGLFGIMEEKPELKPQWKGYTHLAINVRTLFRNIVGAVEKERADDLSPKDYAEILIEEMQIIRNAVADYSDRAIHTIYYASTYKSLSGLYPFAYFKEVKTANQIHYAAMENSTIDNVFKELGDHNDFLVRYDVNITARVKKSLMITHYPFDLLCLKSAEEVVLLESHTGVVKKSFQWNTKLKNYKSLPPMPFDVMTVQMFGDSGDLFIPYPKKIRDKLIAIAEKNNWHSQTTRARIMQCIQLEKDPELLLIVRRLYI